MGLVARPRSLRVTDNLGASFLAYRGPARLFLQIGLFLISMWKRKILTMNDLVDPTGVYPFIGKFILDRVWIARI